MIEASARAQRDAFCLEALLDTQDNPVTGQKVFDIARLFAGAEIGEIAKLRGVEKRLTGQQLILHQPRELVFRRSLLVVQHCEL